MLFSQERGEVKITQSKLALKVHWVKCYFPRKVNTENRTLKEENLNNPVKNSINGTRPGTMQF